MEESIEVLKQRIVDLEAKNERLKKVNRNLRLRLDRFTQQQSRQYRYEQDYLPYPEDDYNR